VTLLTWNPACSVGVRALDDQHGILMDALNDLHLAMVRGSGRAEVSELLNRLVQLTNMHLVSEERLMEMYSFPGLDTHRAEHLRMLSDIRLSALRVQHGEDVGMRTLLTHLRDLYTVHIEGHDSLYGPWLNDHGVN
jgi:hemerythrin